MAATCGCGVASLDCLSACVLALEQTLSCFAHAMCAHLLAAYIQRKEGSQLKVAQDLPSVVLQVSPGFDRPASGSGSRASPLRITVKVDPKYGTAHAVIPVPRNATPASYNLQLWTPSAAGEPMQAAKGDASGNIAVSMPVSTVVPLAEPVRPSTTDALSGAAAANVKAARPAAANGRRLHARAEPPNIAVMPKPKQLMSAGVAPSDPGTTPPGIVMTAPKGLREPDSGDIAAEPTDGLDVTNDTDADLEGQHEQQHAAHRRNALTNGSSQSSHKRQLQQQVEEPTESVMLDEVPANIDIIPDPAAEPAVADTETVTEPAGPAASASLPAVGAAVPRPLPSVIPISTGPEPLGVSLAYTTFTVGDPRPPTASLAVSTGSNWVKPDGSVAVSVTTKSYVGSDVTDAEVTVKWSTGKAEGVLLLKTNSTGGATGTVELAKLPAANRSETGDSLTLKATWIGPTREPLSDSKTVK